MFCTNYHLYLIFFTVPEKCGAPYVPRHATIQNLQLNYDYGDSITVTLTAALLSLPFVVTERYMEWPGSLLSRTYPR